MRVRLRVPDEIDQDVPAVSLSHFATTKAAPASEPYKLADGFGLHLLVQPSGSKLWRFRYRFSGRENMLALGAFRQHRLAMPAPNATKHASFLLPVSIHPH